MHDIIRSINFKKKIIIRNPQSIRPWQHVIEPTLGYLRLAELQYKKKKLHNNQTWNFGPNQRSFVKVIDILKMIKKKFKIEFRIKKNTNFFETKILKLNNNKAKKFLNWSPNWNLQKSIDSVMGWNYEVKKNKNAKEISETQINNYLKIK